MYGKNFGKIKGNLKKNTYINKKKMESIHNFTIRGQGDYFLASSEERGNRRYLRPDEVQKMKDMLNQLGDPRFIIARRFVITMTNTTSLPYLVKIQIRSPVCEDEINQINCVMTTFVVEFDYTDPWLKDLELSIRLINDNNYLEATTPIIEEKIQEGLTDEQINERVNSIQQLPNLSYWLVDKPSRASKLSLAMVYVNRNHPNAQGYDRFVYWPDYKVAGTINNIYNKFKAAGIEEVQVGTLYEMTKGQIGCYRRIANLTLDVIASCSFDPLNQRDQFVYQQTIQGQRPKLVDVQRQLPYSRALNQLTYAPPSAFPGYVGGQEFWNATNEFYEGEEYI